MTGPAWDRLKQLFEQTLEEPADLRAAFLTAACGEDEALRAEVEALVLAHNAAGEFLETPAAAEMRLTPPRGSDDVVGRLVGPYRVVAEIGRGGMGAVYKARREGDDYTQEVALKLVPSGQTSARFAARFRQERRILAGLEHPHIARLIDGGTTDDGRPYYAMEFVDGRPLDVYCVEADLGLRARLELFGTICAAVSFAHRNLVVHRDLKPGNILVAADGSPKLLDFGIAKLLSADDAGEAEHTATGMQLMTPEYASPEQVRGDPVTTATDVYALGVILYLLLTGRRPYEFSTRSAEEIVRTVCYEDPRPPSAMVVAARRQISGDLDTIVLKALRKEPERRYKSVDELSEDVRRYLTGMTVGARPDTLRYRTTKFVTRHRGAVAGAVVAVLILVAGLAATTYQARIAEANRQRAERRFEDVRRIANSLVFELHDSIADLPGATAARALVLRRASDLFDTLVVDAPKDPVLGEEVAAAYHRLGGVLGSEGESSLGDRRAAERAHRKGLEVRRQLAAAAPADLDRQDHLASSHVDLSYAIGDARDALAHASEAAAIGERITRLRPEDLGLRRHLANARFAEGTQLVEVGDLDTARRVFERAAAVYDGLLIRQPGDPTLLRSATLVHKRLGAILTKQRQFPAALEHYRRAVSADERRVAKAAASATARYDLSVSLVDLGVTLGQSGDRDGQIEASARALVIREELEQGRSEQRPFPIRPGIGAGAPGGRAARDRPPPAGACASSSRARACRAPPRRPGVARRSPFHDG